MAKYNQVTLKKMGKATQDFPFKFENGKIILHSSIGEDDKILLRREGKSLIAYKILNPEIIK